MADRTSKKHIETKIKYLNEKYGTNFELQILYNNRYKVIHTETRQPIFGHTLRRTGEMYDFLFGIQCALETKYFTVKEQN